MNARRKFLIGSAAALLSAPAIIRAGSLMKLRKIVVPHYNYYGFCDRLWINSRYENGELRGPALLRMMQAGILQVPPATGLRHEGLPDARGYRGAAAWVHLSGDRIASNWPRSPRDFGTSPRTSASFKCLTFPQLETGESSRVPDRS